MQFAERGNFRRQSANGCGGVASFAVEIDAEAAKTSDAIGGIGYLRFAIKMQRVRRERGKDGGFDFSTVERARFEFPHVTLETKTWRSVGNEEQIASALFD